jgi:hypothetical protein
MIPNVAASFTEVSEDLFKKENSKMVFDVEILFRTIILLKRKSNTKMHEVPLKSWIEKETLK